MIEVMNNVTCTNIMVTWEPTKVNDFEPKGKDTLAEKAGTKVFGLIAQTTFGSQGFGHKEVINVWFDNANIWFTRWTLIRSS